MKLIPPSLPADLPVSSDPAGVVAVCAASGDDVTDRHFLQGVLSGEFPSRMEFRRCRFDGVRMAGSRFDHADFVDVVFSGCDLSGAELSAAASSAAGSKTAKGWAPRSSTVPCAMSFWRAVPSGWPTSPRRPSKLSAFPAAT